MLYPTESQLIQQYFWLRFLYFTLIYIRDIFQVTTDSRKLTDSEKFLTYFVLIWMNDLFQSVQWLWLTLLFCICFLIRTNMSIRKLMDSEEFLRWFYIFYYYCITEQSNSSLTVASINYCIFLSFSQCHISHLRQNGWSMRAQNLRLSGQFDSDGSHIIAPTCHVQEIEHSRLLKVTSKPVKFQKRYFRN